MPNSDLDILAVDTIVGDDGQMPGISQPVTLDDINDVIYAASDPVSVRVEKLRHMKRDFQTRNNADVEGGFDHFIAAIDEGLDELQGPAEGFITPESLDEYDDPAGFDEHSAVDDPDPATTRIASGSVTSRVDLDADSTPDGEPTLNPASRID